ncbi:MAG: glutamate-5-semialdehyde dehydrogenase, partial [Sediminicola sp.]
KDANWEQSLKIILNAKTDKISACNALDKILVDTHIEDYQEKIKELKEVLNDNGVSILVDNKIGKILPEEEAIENEAIWYQEFLAMKCCLGAVDTLDEAIQKINKYSGGHSATIMTTHKDAAKEFMDQVDSAAVYHNASTRFTDGGQMGVGAELAISTDKLHHRGPLGLEQLVTNKYYIFGDGQIRV